MTSLAASSFRSAIIAAPHDPAVANTELTHWRRILAVEPDIAVLDAKSLLLTNSNYCVLSASSEGELFALRHTKAVALAILSDRLGRRLIGTVAATVRRQWPRTRILILGRVPDSLEDDLYDEQMDRSSDPQQVLARLEELYEGMWNRRSNKLDWDATRSARCFSRPQLPESDPTKLVPRASMDDPNLRGTPSDIRIPVTRAA